MKLHVRLFAALRQAAAADSIDVELPEGAVVADLRQYLLGKYPAARALMERSMVAVNTEYADDQTPLDAGVEVALIPPVSGG